MESWHESRPILICYTLLVHSVYTLDSTCVGFRTQAKPLLELIATLVLGFLAKARRPVDLSPQPRGVVGAEQQGTVLVLGGVGAGCVPEPSIHDNDAAGLCLEGPEHLLRVVGNVVSRHPLV